MAHELGLLPQLSEIHNTFHVSMVRKHEPDSRHVLDWSKLNVHPNITYEKVPIQILDPREQVLRDKTISLVKVL